MNNTKRRVSKDGKATGRKSLPAAEPQYPSGYVLPEGDLHTLFENTRFNQVEIIAARLQLIVDLTDQAVEGQLAATDLQRLKQAAAEDSSQDQQQLMQALLRAVEDGPAGLAAARRTAARLVEWYFVFSRERYLSLKMYEARLRRSRK